MHILSIAQIGHAGDIMSKVTESEPNSAEEKTWLFRGEAMVLETVPKTSFSGNDAHRNKIS